MEASTDELEQLCVSDDGWEHPKEKKGVKIHMRYVDGTAIVMCVPSRARAQRLDCR